jgi:hypothetical protein
VSKKSQKNGLQPTFNNDIFHAFLLAALALALASLVLFAEFWKNQWSNTFEDPGKNWVSRVKKPTFCQGWIIEVDPAFNHRVLRNS